jgi:hypothetical protein
LLFPRSLQPRLNGWFSTTYGLACIVGPIVGQFAGAAFGWQAVFHANAPIVAISAIIIVTQMDDVIQPSVEHFDWRGALSFTSATIATCVLLLPLSDPDIHLGRFGYCAIAVLAALSAAAFVYVEAKAESPIVPPEFLAENMFAAAGNVATGAIMFAALMFLPTFASGVLRVPVMLAVLPLTIGIVVGTLSCGRFVGRLRLTRAGPVGASIAALGAGGIATLHATQSVWPVACCAFAIGVGVGFLIVALVIAMQFQAPSERIGMASAMSQFLRSFGGLVGVNLLAALQSSLFDHGMRRAGPVLNSAFEQAGGRGALGTMLFASSGSDTDELFMLVRVTYAHATTFVFVAVAALCVLTACATTRLRSW